MHIIYLTIIVYYSVLACSNRHYLSNQAENTGRISILGKAYHYWNQESPTSKNLSSSAWFHIQEKHIGGSSVAPELQLSARRTLHPAI